jgi:hypothetical protein
MTGECPNCRPGVTCAACLDASPVVAWCDPHRARPPVPASDLRALSHDDASLDAAWNGALDAIRAEGRDPAAVVRCAGEVLAAWRANPYTPEPRR